MSVASRMGQNDDQPAEGPRQEPVFDSRALAEANWDDIRVFLDVAGESSLRAAAAKSGVSVNTVRSRIARLEEAIGGPLIVRGYDGIKLTPSGIQLNRTALGMRGAARIDGGGYSSFLKRPDELRIGASEGIGSGWLTPRLLELQEQYPALTMTMLCDNDLVVDRSDDLDIAITWTKPNNPELIADKLATLHFMPFASRDYIKINGMPKTWPSLLDHRVIEQAGPGIKSELLDHFVGTERPPGFVPIRTNSSLAIFWAVANGAGIAFMPTYASVMVDKLVPIDLPMQLRFDLFYYYHAEARPCGVVRAGVDWLKSCFDPDIYPWFRPERIHPRDFFPKGDDGSNVVPLFQTLVSRPAI